MKITSKKMVWLLSHRWQNTNRWPKTHLLTAYEAKVYKVIQGFQYQFQYENPILKDLSFQGKPKPRDPAHKMSHNMAIWNSQHVILCTSSIQCHFSMFQWKHREFSQKFKVRKMQCRILHPQYPEANGYDT